MLLKNFHRSLLICIWQRSNKVLAYYFFLSTLITESTGKYQEAVDARYVCAISEATIVQEGTGANRTIKITIKWGTKWGKNVNPYNYFNGKDANEKVKENGETTYSDLAKTELTEMYNLLNNVKFTITVTAK